MALPLILCQLLLRRAFSSDFLLSLSPVRCCSSFRCAMSARDQPTVTNHLNFDTVRQRRIRPSPDRALWRRDIRPFPYPPPDEHDIAMFQRFQDTTSFISWCSAPTSSWAELRKFVERVEGCHPSGIQDDIGKWLPWRVPLRFLQEPLQQSMYYNYFIVLNVQKRQRCLTLLMGRAKHHHYQDASMHMLYGDKLRSETECLITLSGRIEHILNHSLQVDAPRFECALDFLDDHDNEDGQLEGPWCRTDDDPEMFYGRNLRR